MFSLGQHCDRTTAMENPTMTWGSCVRNTPQRRLRSRSTPTATAGTTFGASSDSSFPALGPTVCHSSGKFTAAGPGEYCGEVTDWVDFASSGSTTQNWTEVDPFQTNNQAGASGGPWYRSYSGSSVVGMGIHTASTADNTRNTYERIQPVRDALAGEASVTIYCNRGSGQVACLVNH